MSAAKKSFGELGATLSQAMAQVPRMSVWSHYKTGTPYVILGHLIREEDGEILVVYTPVVRDVFGYPDSIRPSVE